MMNEYTSYHDNMVWGSRITWAVQRLILANILVFALQVIADPLIYAIFPFGAQQMIAPGGRLNIWLGFQPDTFLAGHLWKPFTYQFLHGGLMHLFFNMLWLFFFGPDVERRLGTQSFFRFYIFCGAAGVLLSLLPYSLGLYQNQLGMTIGPSITGASGAVMGVLVAFAIIDPERQLYLFPLPMPINARAMVIVVVIMNIIMGLGANSNVSVVTHFGGMIAGAVYIKGLPIYNQWRWHNRQRAGEKRRNAKQDPLDKVGEAVDNIFKFKDR